MQSTLLLFLFLLFMYGLSGAETDEYESEPVSVMEGDSVTLHTNLTEIQNDDTILWMFGPKDSLISQITRKADFTSFFVTDDDVGFRGRLQVDQNTASLTIRSTRIRLSGQYKLTISREKTRYKIFNVTVFGVVGETNGVKSVSVMEGNSVTLNTDTEIHTDDLIVWRFGDKGILLAKIYVETNETSLNYADENFRDRLKLDQTGSLTITNTRTTDSGVYELQIRGSQSSHKTFFLSVSDSDLSPWAVTGICVVSVFLTATITACCYHRIAGKEKKVSVTEGDSFTLCTDVTKLHKDHTIQWWYEDEDNLIAEIKGGTSKKHDVADERFGDRLTLNDNTGSLTIRDIRTIHSGLYKLKISSNTCAGCIVQCKRFILTVNNEEKMPVKKGESVNLKTNTEIQRDDQILWLLGYENTIIAQIKGGTGEIITDDVADERFRGRLELNNRTGSLTIKNSETEDTEVYKLKIRSDKGATNKRFRVGIYDEEREVSGKEGKTIILNTDDEMQKNDQVWWLFGEENSLIAEIKGGTGDIITYGGTGGRFRDRLKLDKKTGSLTITNIRSTDAGLYQVWINRSSSRKNKHLRFTVSFRQHKMSWWSWFQS
ncbi:uncharacterized protein LOC127519752 isoform X2 [Ctenopharyngodon idella]|uniref:uncharacterized protein LOC127519752 isoform X2 n=1 Tax=Ctenopharyngodon idella TaxID=7959 RepID=UPI00222E1EA3|nr:uncharacterized protein LOC127519752 isoform X2 [Ctenopharyngodon idella]